MGDAPDTNDLVEVVLDAVRAHAETGQHVLLLRERAGERVLALWVGPSEANAAAVRLNGMTTARPLTHDLLATMVRRAAASVERVVITHQAEQVFYAIVRLNSPGGPEEIDARPSDAVNVALRTGAPILVAARVMDEAARAPDPACGRGRRRSSCWRSRPARVGTWVSCTFARFRAPVTRSPCTRRPDGGSSPSSLPRASIRREWWYGVRPPSDGQASANVAVSSPSLADSTRCEAVPLTSYVR
jgi:uncharacterized protein